jgi:hypothetical protein
MTTGEQQTTRGQQLASSLRHPRSGILYLARILFALRSTLFALRPTLYALRSTLFDTRGYTLVETLVAGAILLGVLAPASLILGELALSQYHHDLIVATQLARDEMERAILDTRYQSDEKLVEFGNKSWRLVREAHDRFGLIEIRIAVFRPRRAKPLVEIKTLRLSNSTF